MASKFWGDRLHWMLPADFDEDDESVQWHLSHESKQNDNILLKICLKLDSKTYIECPLQFSSWCGETVEDEILSHTVDPLSPGRQWTTDKVSPVSLPRREGSDNLSLHVHDDHSVSSVADNDLVHVLGHHVDAVDVNISSRCSSQRFERVLTLCSLGVPDLHCSVTRGAGGTLDLLKF